ncbi:L,D-transpeptidase [Chelativorans salis]|uniref:L,D-transpeptidase n=1 Tax=Chelativorans salis TaxID=2978478 RepID=A0ABT2LJI9_9HYPH|nr:L,D-transpeptidase [Chelativorans sp. EGI FJ00035]MCT7374715.1 L,D-transpeptidase [Chelativorans sp. EGI FJ00035]
MSASKTTKVVGEKLTRRGLLASGLAFLASGCVSVPRRVAAPAASPPADPYARMAQFEVDPVYRRQRVPYDGAEGSGTIVVDRGNRFLYFVEDDSWATRYGVGIGKEGRTLSGRLKVGRKAEWPSWTPTANMMKREPRYLQFAGGVPGGIHNPLGARALYLYRGGRDTMYRIHGTNEPWSIGQAVSSGCIRLTNDDIIHLHDRTPVGATVVII